MKRQFFLKCIGAAASCALPLAFALAQAAPTPSPTPGTSAWVFFGSNHRLQYTPDANGNRIMDYSFAGYMGGGVALPGAPVQATVNPSGGDDTAAIQAAIDSVSALPPDANGFRGTVLLAPGAFSTSSTLKITTGGVILHGSGTDSNGTIIT